MRLLVLLLLATSCRQALGIPSGGTEDGVGFHVRVEVQGATGASGGAQVVLTRSGSNDVTVETLLDDTTVLATALQDHEDFEITPMSGNCRIVDGRGTIEGDDANGGQITCDGLAALGDFGFSAPITFEPAFDGSVDEPRPLASIIVQETTWAPKARHSGIPIGRATYGGQDLGPGPFPIAPGTAWGVELSNAGFDRVYTADPIMAPPTAFGYGKPSVTEAKASFGAAVAAFDKELVVGAPDAATPSVVVFLRDELAWTETQRIPGEPGKRFGAAIAVSADTLAIGEPLNRRVLVFTRTGATWTQSRTLTAATASDATDAFGTAIAIQNATTIFVGDKGCRGTGCVFRFDNSVQTAVIDQGARAGDEFGASIAVTVTHLVVGMPGDDSAIPGDPLDSQFPDAGAVRVFAFPDLTTSEYLKAEAPGVADRFGTSVAIDTSNGVELIVVGAPFEDSAVDAMGVGSPDDNSKTDAGAAFMFQLQGTWVQTAFVKAPNADFGDNFGAAVAIKSAKIGTAPATCVIAIGAPFEDSADRGNLADETAVDSGAVYAFRVAADGQVSSAGYGKATNIGAFDGFGSALALTSESLLVGSPFEDSSRSGWNTTGDEAALDSGAVYSLR